MGLLPSILNSPYISSLAEKFFNETQNNIVSLNNSIKSNIYERGANSFTKLTSLPSYNAAKSTKGMTHNDSSIMFLQAAEQGPGTGAGALGGRASSIDLKCGRVSSITNTAKNPDIFVNDSFLHDAARIYISQDTSLDKACKISEADNPKFENRSGIALIADNIAIKGRLGVKITTSPNGESNSKSGKISSGTGIELIANNDVSDVQPIVKGNNLISAINTINKRMNKLTGMIMDIAADNATLRLSLAVHTHPLLFPLALPSPELSVACGISIAKNMKIGVIDGLSQKANLWFDDFNYTYSVGGEYINSDFNRTN